LHTPRTDLAQYFRTTLSPHSAHGRLKKHSTAIVTAELYNHVFEHKNDDFHLLSSILSSHMSYPLIAMYRSCVKHRLTLLMFLLCIRRKLRLPIYSNRTPCILCGLHDHDIYSGHAFCCKRGTKNVHTTSLLGILLELYLLFWHKQAISTITLPWLSNHCSISAPTPQHDLSTYHSLLIPHLAATVPTPPLKQTSTSLGPHLHPRPPKLKIFSTQSLPMQITTFSIMNKANLGIHTNPPPPPHPSFMVMMSLAKCIKKTWASSPSPLTPGQDLDLCYKHSSPPPTIPIRNPGTPHTPPLNITTPMPSSCTNKPPNHHAHLVSSH
jgi:hypothetical protein